MIGLSRNLSHHRQCKRKIVRALLVPQNRQPNILRPLPTRGCFQAKAAAKMGSDDWEKYWKEGSTRWDLGGPTPVVIQLVKSGSLPMGRVLVPGCGSGYDVVAMAGHKRYVVGLDISTTAIEIAKENAAHFNGYHELMHSQSSQCFICLKVKSQCIKWLSSWANADQFTFVSANFFTWQPTEKFDLIFDYLFFCAIHPRLRPDWAKRVQELLKPDGELITLISLISDEEAGPPYNTTISDYEKVLNPLGFKAISVEDNEVAVKFRKGREKLARWKRTTP